MNKKDIRKVLAMLRKAQKEFGSISCDFWACDGVYRREPKDQLTCSVCRGRNIIHNSIEVLKNIK